MYQLDYKK